MSQWQPRFLLAKAFREDFLSHSLRDQLIEPPHEVHSEEVGL
jgi:hypothetical protein